MEGKWARQDLSARARSIRPSRNPEVKDRGERARARSIRPSRNPEVKDRGVRARVNTYNPSLSPMLLPRDQAMAG